VAIVLDRGSSGASNGPLVDRLGMALRLEGFLLWEVAIAVFTGKRCKRAVSSTVKFLLSTHFHFHCH
jgi:hypothetical protein